MLALLVLFFVATLDRFTKVVSLRAPMNSTSLLGEVFVFQPSFNSGGLLSLDVPYTLLLVLTFFLGGLFFILAFRERALVGQLAFGLIALGIASNGYDRLAFGYVVDVLRLFSLSFNLADLFIVSGVALVCWRLVQAGPRASIATSSNVR